MPRNKDEDRILWLLGEAGGKSSSQVKSTLNLSDKRFDEVRDLLIGESLIEKYRCRGGGIQLTKKGAQQKTLEDVVSMVNREDELYPYLIASLEKEAEEEEESAVVCNTGSLRMRGKWSNPDVAKLAIRNYPILRKQSVICTTYEVKQWGRWNVSSVYEAASHSRFAHQSYLVLEWAERGEVEGLDELLGVCGRYGVGLITLHKYYTGARHTLQYEAANKTPSDDLLEEFLSYVFERNVDDGTRFQTLMTA